MVFAVVPAQNEENRVPILINRLLKIEEINYISIILNGSTDKTGDILKKYQIYKKIEVIEFPVSLGVDVPRAVGAFQALSVGANYVLFVDGDLIGDITEGIRKLIYNSVSHKLDMGLTDCYPQNNNVDSNDIKYFRQLLNIKIRRPDLGIATPSHGPSIISDQLLKKVPIKELCIPPVPLALGQKFGRRIAIATTISHPLLGSSLKTDRHNKMIRETIIGDTLEAIAVYEGKKRTRHYGKSYYLGYHRYRRFDLFDKYINFK